MLKVMLIEKLNVLTTRERECSYIRHTEYDLYVCIRTQLASPDEFQISVFITRS